MDFEERVGCLKSGPGVGSGWGWRPEGRRGPRAANPGTDVKAMDVCSLKALLLLFLKVFRGGFFVKKRTEKTKMKVQAWLDSNLHPLGTDFQLSHGRDRTTLEQPEHGGNTTLFGPDSLPVRVVHHLVQHLDGRVPPFGPVRAVAEGGTVLPLLQVGAGRLPQGVLYVRFVSRKLFLILSRCTVHTSLRN